MTTPSTTVAHRFAAAFNTADVDRLVACFSEHARYDDLFHGRATGRSAIRTMFTRMIAEGDRHEWALGTVVQGPGCTVAEWQFTLRVAENARTGAGRTVCFPGVSVFETSEDLCHAYRERFDRAAVLFAMGIPPAQVAALVRRRSTVRLRPVDG